MGWEEERNMYIKYGTFEVLLDTLSSQGQDSILG